MRIEEERARGTRSDPDREAKPWLGQLEEIDTKRSRFQDMAAEGLISFEELRAKLYSLDESRKVAKEELERLRVRSERIATLEHDKDTLLASLEGVVPGLLDQLSSESRNRVYKMLDLKVEATSGSPLKVTGAFAGELGVWITEPRS